MKRFISVIFISLLMAGLFAQEKIGTAHENTYYIDVINGNIPVSLHYEYTDGFISTITNYYISIGDKTFGPYQSLLWPQMINNSVYYKARSQEKWRLYKNGTPISEEYEDFGHYIDPDNEDITYRYKQNNTIYLKKNGKIIDEIDGSYNFYTAVPNYRFVALGKEEQFYLRKDKTFYGPLKNLYSFIELSDGALYFITEKDEKKYLNTTNGVYAGPFDYIGIENDNASNLKNDIIYITIANDKETLWINKTKIFEADELELVDYTGDENSVDINSFIIKYKKDNGYYVKTKNKTYGPYNTYNVESIYTFISPDKKLLAIVYKDLRNNTYIQVGSEIAGPYRKFNGLIFSKDSSKIAYFVKDKNYDNILMINNKEYGKYDDINDCILSDDGKDIMLVRGEEGQQYLYKKKFSSKKYESIHLGKYKNSILSYSVRIEDETLFFDKLLINNQEYTGSFTSDGTGYVYIDGENIYYKKF